MRRSAPDVLAVPGPEFQKHRREIERCFVDFPLPRLERKAEDLGDLAGIGHSLGITDAAIEHRMLPGGHRTGRQLGQFLEFGRQTQFLAQFADGAGMILLAGVDMARRR